MKFQSLPLLAATLGTALARPFRPQAAKPPYFVLTGDSTVAVAGGWGDGFLSFIEEPAGGENPAKGGATTVSFRNEGRWANALAAVEAHAADYEPVVTIQFGHNDQKEAAGISEDQFRENLEVMAKEVQAAGGTPIIITSLTRRTFQDGSVIENLATHSRLAIEAAEAVGAQYLDLNKASTEYINAVGQEKADTYNLADGDRTHLNKGGERLFGRMVVDLLLQKRADFGQYFEQAGELSRLIWSGEYATGEE